MTTPDARRGSRPEGGLDARLDDRLDDWLDDWLADPSPRTAEPLHAVVRDAGTADDQDRRRDAAERSRRGDHAGALAVLGTLLPGALLSPSVHARQAAALRHLGREHEAARQERIARASLAAIRASGDGTAERPWSVLRVADEYDLLRALGRRPVNQSLVGREGRALDRLVTEDGGEAWFAVAGLGAPTRG
ncbi:DUF4919 domain-containing protein [Nocardioides sp. NPDC092400]|uniref:DUF4919 domain-containing protein n=1 Tax=Nocardioides sp. NPDC092400 TaxID=3155196 RepID=UPI0034383A8D